LAFVTALIAATAAAVARTAFARIARIFAGSRPFGGRSDILAIFFLVQLGRIGSKNVKGIRETETSIARPSDEIVQKFTSASLARAMTLTVSFPLANQNSLANLFLMAWTSSLARIIEVLVALGN
jgi:hypothetical protein